jgi:hypothetical protein
MDVSRHILVSRYIYIKTCINGRREYFILAFKTYEMSWDKYIVTTVLRHAGLAECEQWAIFDVFAQPPRTRNCTKNIAISLSVLYYEYSSRRFFFISKTGVK